MLKEFYSRLIFVLLLSATLLGTTNSHAQPVLDAEGPYIVNFMTLSGGSSASSDEESGLMIVHEHEIPPGAQFPPGSGSGGGNSAPAPQQTFQPSPPPAINFEGQDQTAWIPPDTNGAVSSQFVLTTVNNDANVRDRNGNLLAAVGLNDFWAATNTTDNSFDTRSRFDPYAQRFIIMSAGSLGDQPNSSILLAVSQTSDPTGNWILYRVPVNAGTPQHWADYPTIGFNSKWIAVHANLFPIDGSGADFTTRLWAFNKADLYAAGPGLYTQLPGLGVTTQPAETYDATNPDLFFLQQDSNCSVALYRMSGNVGAESTAFIASVPAPLCWTGNIPPAPQAGTSQMIFPGINWMMDAIYRNGAVWGTQVVEPIGGPTRTAAQWWRIGTAGNLIDFGRVDDPTGVAFYGFPSIAANANNDALIGFTRFSADTFPSAAYAFRAASDPAGTFRDPVVYMSGLTPYGADRWGDYSHTQVDPVNDTDFWTVQEITGNFGWATWWARVVPGTVAANIDVRLRSGALDPTNSPHPQLRVVNQGTSPLSLNTLTLRYWFNCDCNPATTTMNGVADWAGLLPSGQAITSQVQISFERTSAGGQTHAMVIRFTGGAVVQPGQTVEVQTRFNKPNWSLMPQGNDYSFAPFNNFTSWNRVTAYINGVLVRGQEP